MRVLVCVKRVPAPGAKILLTPDAQEIDASLLGFAVSPHEECAVEEAVGIVERLGGSVTVMTLGPPEAEEQLRAAVAVGAESAVLLQTDWPDWDPVSTSVTLVEAIRSAESTAGEPFDLILFGNESADSGGYQVGIRVAWELRRPVVTGIKGVEVAEGSVTARRQTSGGWEVYKVPLPAVLAVKEGINLPRYPTLRGRLSAKKVEVEVVSTAPVGSGQSKLRLETPPASGSTVQVLGDSPSAAGKVVDVLEELGLL